LTKKTSRNNLKNNLLYIKKYMITNINNIIKKAKTIAIFGHENIDGDALWAMLGLGTLLEDQKKIVKYFSPDKPSQIFDNIQWIDKLQTEFTYNNFDLLIFVDFTENKRIRKFTTKHENYFQKNKLIIFDHHKWNNPTNSTDYIIDTNALSTCDIIYETISQLRPNKISNKIANHLYLWITTDTGNFMYWNNKSSIRTMQNAVNLIKLWADKEHLIDIIFNRQSPEILTLQGLLSKRAKYNNINNNKKTILYTYYNIAELDKLWLDKEQAKMIFSSTMKRIYWPKIFILIRKEHKEVRWSIRTWTSPDKKINCAKLSSELFGGGGHENAAGFCIPLQKPFTKQIDEIIKKIENYI